MQMQNNKPGLFILQTRAGGLSPLIFTSFSSLLVTGNGEEGNLNVAVLDLFGTEFFFLQFSTLNILYFSIQILSIVFFFVIRYIPSTKVKEM